MPHSWSHCCLCHAHMQIHLFCHKFNQLPLQIASCKQVPSNMLICHRTIIFLVCHNRIHIVASILCLFIIIVEYITLKRRLESKFSLFDSHILIFSCVSSFLHQKSACFASSSKQWLVAARRLKAEISWVILVVLGACNITWWYAMVVCFLASRRLQLMVFQGRDPCYLKQLPHFFSGSPCR